MKRLRYSELCAVLASSRRWPGGGTHGGAGFRRPRAASWRSRAAPPRSLGRQLAAAWRVVTAAATEGQRLPGAAERGEAALRGDGFPRLRPGAAAVPREKDKNTPVRNGTTRRCLPAHQKAANPNSHEATSTQQVVWLSL